MTAGSGVAHSERSPDDARAATSPLAGLQTWVALPDESEEAAPSFQHAGGRRAPGGRRRRGQRSGCSSGPASARRHRCRARRRCSTPTCTSPPAAASPLPPEHAERAVLVVDGDVEVDGAPSRRATWPSSTPGDAVVPSAPAARVMTFGGAPVGTPLHLVELRGVERRTASRRRRPTGPPTASARSPATTPTASSSRPADRPVPDPSSRRPDLAASRTGRGSGHSEAGEEGGGGDRAGWGAVGDGVVGRPAAASC